MKKVLLSLAAIALSATGMMANEHTIDFTGTSDMYGLTRISSVPKADSEFVTEWSFSEAGIDFTAQRAADNEAGKGYCLVNAGGNNIGLAVWASFTTSTPTPNTIPNLKLTVPGGKINGVRVNLTGYALSALELVFNGTEVSPSSASVGYSWSWTDAEGMESVDITWASTFGIRYIRSIEVSYTPDLGGKQECGLSFSDTAAELIMGEPFTAPILSNPNNLPLTWTSSDESVATVDSEGNITALKGGDTTITVTTEGDASFAAGNAKYELSVVPTAANIKAMLEAAPEPRDRVKVDFPATVAFANGNFAYVFDAEGNAGCFQDIRNAGSTATTATTLYKVGDILPAGWIATNATLYEDVRWEGIPGAVTEKTEVTYPEVESVTPADVNKVVILKNVTFSTRTAAGVTKAYGVTPDGTRYEFQDTFEIGDQPAGTYDVTGVVKYSKVGSTVYFYIAPISYTISTVSGVETIEAAAADARYYDINGVETANPEKGVYVKVSGGKATKVIVK